ncbi:MULTISPECIES: helix-turn-helix domain-containing protein [Alicyclobacillus]|uniref:Plasmid maintenance system antidote protein, XRE family n=1 Tax=Alicyclobacillus acidocaldarius subsp. acidocaldarius (strain ATCC 27009 / DSM 446 / BCRC 14685 / JCM 5260 / KCTC 1825 / NBRC 15652 / NCIMB 11725 / NRRL B-14509 / 104-IA) TaxID=521098 RepID=C8WS95_ALIAD|nr:MULTISPECIES: helix-turn-helix transcriptional regulator [Alicyclobacillus]ACV57529.1 plasmid maintenance system antidote protein, XRE family [Alicyclobacillus acidocaldarius subsp. acidocaldarius DSM 446]
MTLFSQRLTELLDRTGTTRRSFAQALGVSERMVQYYITGKKDPTVETLIAIADFFDVSLDYLVGRSENPERK